MRKVETEVASLIEDEIDVSTESCGDQRIMLWGPSDFSYKNTSKSLGCISANRRNVWWARSDGLALLKLGTELTEDNIAK